MCAIFGYKPRFRKRLLPSHTLLHLSPWSSYMVAVGCGGDGESGKTRSIPNDAHAYRSLRNTASEHTHTFTKTKAVPLLICTSIKPSRGLMILHHKGCPQLWPPSKLFQGMELTRNRPDGMCPSPHLHSA